jgi:IclR family pca regulon transcriptional regulator
MQNAQDIPLSDTSLTFAKGLAVMKCFDATSVTLTIPEIARRCDLDRAVARRLVLTLVRLGYVRQRGRSYSLSPRILVLAGGFLQGRRFGLAVQPVIEGFAAQIGQPLMLAMRDGTDAIYVAHAGIEGVMPRLGFTVGSRLPLLASSLGRALLTAEDPETRHKLIAEAPLTAWTERTVTDRAALARMLDAVPAGTPVQASCEFEPGVTATSLGFRCDGGEIVAIGHSAESAIYAEPGFPERIGGTLQRCAAALRGLL